MVGITAGTTHSTIGTHRTDGVAASIGIIGTLLTYGAGICRTTIITITHTDLHIRDLHRQGMEALATQAILTIVQAWLLVAILVQQFPQIEEEPSALHNR